MSAFKLHFSGEIRWPKVKEYNGKQILSFQVSKKNYNKDTAAPAEYTQVNVTIFDAKPFQIQQFAEKTFVAGSGELTMHSFVDKDGAKRQSADVRCNSMDVDSPYVARDQQASAAKEPHAQAQPAVGSHDEPPF